MKSSLVSWVTYLTKPAVAIGGAVVIGGALVAYTFFSTAVAPAGATATVMRGAITEEVDVSGTVQAAHSSDLAFQIPGRISGINVAVGDHVNAGQTLLSLDGSSQAAALAGSKASLEIQQANLASLLSGTRPEQLSIDETNVAQAASALTNAIDNAYVAADDAVHVKADQVFTNPRTSDVAFSFSVADSTLAARVLSERAALEPALAAWQASLTSANTDPETAATTATATLSAVAAFLDDLATALSETPSGGNLSAATLSGYQTSINAARTEITGALTGVLPGVTSALTSYKAAEGALALAKAGATPDQIAAEQAAVDAAQASVQAAQVALGETVLTAPVSGIVTAQDADPGETVAPGVPLVSLLADGKFQAMVRVSDTDIGKIKVGDDATATFDAYPGATFDANVTTVDPAASVVDGVSGYGVTVTFTNDDPRLSSGLSGTLRIITATKSDVLLIPTSAVIANGAQEFVYVDGPHGPVQTSVTIGIESADGMTEVVSGLSEGQTVLTYGSSGLSS